MPTVNKTVKATLLVEVVKTLDKNYDGKNDETTLQRLVKEDLQFEDYDVKKCELLDCKKGLILEQLKRVDEAELNYQMEIAKLNEMMKRD